MWKRGFVATSVALGGTVNDAVSAIGEDGGAEVDALVAGLGATDRRARAAALASAVRDVVLAIDEATLR